MKIVNVSLLIAVTIAFFSYGCPTCVGKIKSESLAFFSHEFYQPGQSIPRETKEQVGDKELKKIFTKKETRP